MKKMNKISAAVSAAAAVLMLTASVSADGVKYKTNADKSGIVITDTAVNSAYRREYMIDPSGHGVMYEETNIFYVSAKVKDTSKLPDNVIVKNGYEVGLPDIDGVYIYTKDSAVKYQENTFYSLTKDKAKALAAELNKLECVSDIQIYQSKDTSDFSLSGNIYQIADITYSYKYNESDFAALTDKGYMVSKIDCSQPDMPDYFELSIIPPECGKNPSDGRVLYQTLLDISGLELPEGVEIMPLISCQGSDNSILEKYRIIGDVNRNFTIDLYDAIETAEYIIGIKKFTDEEKSAADINGDNNIDLYDTIEIAKSLI